jgi:hypothetical protein
MRMDSRWCVTVLIGGAAMFVSLPALADVGIPAGAVFWPASWLLLIPVVLIEAGIARRILGLRFSQCLKVSLKANLWSTLAGVPLACLLMLVVGLFLGSGPHRGGGSPWLADLFLGSAVWLGGLPDWAIFAGPALICVPCYFLSVRTTYGLLVGALLVAAALTRR